MTRLRPASACRALLDALDASEGRRRRRKRDTTPDAIGMSFKRDLLEAAVRYDPEPDDFEAWLLQRCLSGEAASLGAMRAMAREVFTEWTLMAASGQFRDWLAAGAPSEDRTIESGAPEMRPSDPEQLQVEECGPSREGGTGVRG
jgi:hypothetical protein